MRKFALSIAAVVVLAAPQAAEARGGGILTSREARSVARSYVTAQVEGLRPGLVLDGPLPRRALTTPALVEALRQFRGLTVVATRVSARVDRVGPARLTVPVAFALRWDDGPGFVCLNRVYVSKHGRSIQAQPGNFDC